ncbi:MAG: nucleotide pyrophosphohydrolase [Candidatus Heimdallarchaeota archaeon]
MVPDKSNDQFEYLKSKMDKFLEERNWKGYHTPKNIAMSISIEAAELMEIFQWINPSSLKVTTNQKLMAEIEDEVADIIIYTISLARSLDIDIFDIVNKKMDKNHLRFPPTKEI